MIGARLVTIAIEYSTSSAQRSLFAWMPSTQRVRKTSATLASRRQLSRTACAMTGMPTFSSNWLSCAPAHVTVASLPITRAQTCITDSHITGFTLPGMIELPGCVSGSRISPMPQRGPLPSQRRSLAIFVSDTAMVLRWPLASTSPSLQLCASKWLRASRNSLPVSRSRCPTTRPAKSGWQLSPVPTAVPPMGSSSTSWMAAFARWTASSHWRA